MTSDMLVYTLFGGKASWGGRTSPNGKKLPTHKIPTKSALIGMIGAALGWTREDDPEIGRSAEDRLDQLHQDLAVAVRIESIGVQQTDYQVAQAPKLPLGQLPSWGRRIQHRRHELGVSSRLPSRDITPDECRIERMTSTPQNIDYLCDVMYTVALWYWEGCDPVEGASLGEIQHALHQPTFSLYMGRRDHTLGVPPDPEIVNDIDHPSDALDSRTSFRHVAQYRPGSWAGGPTDVGMPEIDPDALDDEARRLAASMRPSYSMSDETISITEVYPYTVEPPAYADTEGIRESRHDQRAPRSDQRSYVMRDVRRLTVDYPVKDLFAEN